MPYSPALLLPLIAFALVVVGLVAIAFERRGRLAAPRIRLKGDVFREAQWLGQYGQASCFATVIALVWLFHVATPGRDTLVILSTWVGGWFLCNIVKRLTGRVRPEKGRDGHQPGSFLGPSWTFDAWRESFPSSHAAAACGLSASLWVLHPEGGIVYLVLAICASLLRWLTLAHWLSDVLVGAAIGCLTAWIVTTIIL